MHLSVNTDTVDVYEIAVRSAKAAADKVHVIVAPRIPYGHSENHMDFPGTITLSQNTLISTVVEVCKSIHHHGFKRILILNGHGGNSVPLHVATNQVRAETDLFVVLADYWALASEKISEVRESATGGINHGCELETSLQLVLQPELVHMDKAQKVIPKHTEYVVRDIIGPKKVYSPGWTWM